MSEQPVTLPGVPQWDVADRMRKALRHSSVSVTEMGAYLGVTPRTISGWINGHVTPATRTLRLWALRTGVPFIWLQTGQMPTSGGKTDLNHLLPLGYLRPRSPLLTAAAA